MNSILNRGRSTNCVDLKIIKQKEKEKDKENKPRMFGREITNFIESKSTSSKALDFSDRVHKPETKNKEFYERIAQEAMKKLNPIDKENYGKQYEMAEYAEEIYHYLQKIENDHIAKHGFMKNQPELNEKMRTVLIDWMVEVHQKFKLLPETLYLAVNLLDRYIEKEKIPKNKLQLVGVSAMLIACKYEEIYAPEVKDFIYITDKSFTKEEIVKMEQKILCKLKFEIAFPSAFRFLERYNKLAKGDDVCFFMAQYAMELSMLDYKMLRYTPSMMAASTISVAMKALKKPSIWNDVLKSQTNYTESDLASCVKDVCDILKGADKLSQQAAKRKFAQPKYKEVSKHKIEL